MGEERILSLVTAKEYKDFFPPVDEHNTGNNASAPRLGPAFTNRVVRYIGGHKAKLDTKAQDVEDLVMKFIKDILQKVKEADQRFSGEIVPCGSYYEGVKVKEPNEFDFSIRLKEAFLKPEQLTLIQQEPPSFKPIKEETKDIRAGSFFWLQAEGLDPPLKEDIILPRSENGGLIKYLSPRKVQEKFRDLVKKATLVMVGGGKAEAYVKVSGPAVAVVAKMSPENFKRYLTKPIMKRLKEAKKEYFLIKVDLTLAIPIDMSLSALDTLLDLEVMKPRTGTCHLVVAGDYWRASLDHLETKTIKKHTSKPGLRKECLLSMKYIRDTLSITEEDHEPSILATYPMKVTFLKENQKRSEDAEWDFWHIAERTTGILKDVEQNGMKGRLTNYFFENDPILLEGDNSYLECRRIRLYLEELYTEYVLHGKMHTAILVATFAFFVVDLIASAFYFKEFLWDLREASRSDSFNTSVCEQASAEESIQLGVYLQALFVSTFLALGSSLVGLLVFLVSRFQSSRKVNLYKMYSLIAWFHGLGMTTAGLLVLLGVILALHYDSVFLTCHSEVVFYGLVVAIVLIGLYPLLALIHVMVFLAKTRCKPQHYPWEWVFCDELYRKKYEQLPATQKGKAETPRDG